MVEGNTPASPRYATASKVLRVLGRAQILIPIGAVLVTLPGSLYILVFGGIIIIAPPIALGVISLGLARSLAVGQRVAATALWAGLLVCLYVALALHSTTWDPSSPGDARLYVLCGIVFWIAAAGYLSILVLLGLPTKTPAEAVVDIDLYPALRPKIWPWLVAAILILATILLGLPVAGTSGS